MGAAGPFERHSEGRVQSLLTAHHLLGTTLYPELHTPSAAVQRREGQCSGLTLLLEGDEGGHRNPTFPIPKIPVLPLF